MTLTDAQRSALRAFCDTLVPPIERDDDPDGFWARRASDLGVEQGVEQILFEIPDETVRAGMLALVDALVAMNLDQVDDQAQREALLGHLSAFSEESAAGVQALANMTLFLFYGAPDPRTGINPAWRTFGYAGPASPPPDVPKAIRTYEPTAGEVLEADVVIVGSGAGGATIAASLSEQGLAVVVLEAAGYFNESDFAQLELAAYQQMYWRGGPTPTADGNVTLQAGTTLGGGTTINWTNCLRTTPWVREQWAREFGLEGVDGADYDRHLDAVLTRIGATPDCSDLNGPQQRMKEGADRLGWSFSMVLRNADPATYWPDSAGYLGFGDQSGSKLTAEKTWLRDAHERGARILVHTRAQRVLTESGRAAGVEAVSPAGALTVRAPQVVVAAGALESPALLLRSGIGGPAVGRYLRVHPCVAAFGVYAEDPRAWWGPPHAGLCDEFAAVEDGYGFLVEGAQYAPAIIGSALPWRSGAEHKELLHEVRRGATFIALTRDHGHGEVVVDANGEAVPTYAITDELDRRNLARGWDAMIRIHEAAGAEEIYALASALPRWRRGEDLEAFIAHAQAQPLRAGGARLFSAHQMGTCRMGTDPQESVAGPWGELHDTAGVWVGDGSAFPTASGTNPMVSIMALAHRTAEAIAAAAPSRARAGAA